MAPVDYVKRPKGKLRVERVAVKQNNAAVYFTVFMTDEDGDLWKHTTSSFYFDLKEATVEEAFPLPWQTAVDKGTTDWTRVFDTCKDGHHKECIGSTRQLYRDGRLMICRCCLADHKLTPEEV